MMMMMVMLVEENGEHKMVILGQEGLNLIPSLSLSYLILESCVCSLI